ncbi:MAG: ROK family protein, partial [Chlamydiota bacterium]|nr:ROK family protein [Chlamydiota bacterium]
STYHASQLRNATPGRLLDLLDEMETHGARDYHYTLVKRHMGQDAVTRMQRYERLVVNTILESIHHEDLFEALKPDHMLQWNSDYTESELRRGLDDSLKISLTGAYKSTFDEALTDLTSRLEGTKERTEEMNMVLGQLKSARIRFKWWLFGSIYLNRSNFIAAYGIRDIDVLHVGFSHRLLEIINQLPDQVRSAVAQEILYIQIYESLAHRGEDMPFPMDDISWILSLRMLFPENYIGVGTVSLFFRGKKKGRLNDIIEQYLREMASQYTVSIPVQSSFISRFNTWLKEAYYYSKRALYLFATKYFYNFPKIIPGIFRGLGMGAHMVVSSQYRIQQLSDAMKKLLLFTLKDPDLTQEEIKDMLRDKTNKSFKSFSVFILLNIFYEAFLATGVTLFSMALPLPVFMRVTIAFFIAGGIVRTLTMLIAKWIYPPLKIGMAVMVTFVKGFGLYFSTVQLMRSYNKTFPVLIRKHRLNRFSAFVNSIIDRNVSQDRDLEDPEVMREILTELSAYGASTKIVGLLQQMISEPGRDWYADYTPEKKFWGRLWDRLIVTVTRRHRDYNKDNPGSPEKSRTIEERIPLYQRLIDLTKQYSSSLVIDFGREKISAALIDNKFDIQGRIVRQEVKEAYRLEDVGTSRAEIVAKLGKVVKEAVLMAAARGVMINDVIVVLQGHTNYRTGQINYSSRFRKVERIGFREVIGNFLQESGLQERRMYVVNEGYAAVIGEKQFGFPDAENIFFIGLNTSIRAARIDRNGNVVSHAALGHIYSVYVHNKTKKLNDIAGRRNLVKLARELGKMPDYVESYRQFSDQYDVSRGIGLSTLRDALRNGDVFAQQVYKVAAEAIGVVISTAIIDGSIRTDDKIVLGGDLDRYGLPADDAASRQLFVDHIRRIIYERVPEAARSLEFTLLENDRELKGAAYYARNSIDRETENIGAPEKSYTGVGGTDQETHTFIEGSFDDDATLDASQTVLTQVAKNMLLNDAVFSARDEELRTFWVDHKQYNVQEEYAGFDRLRVVVVQDLPLEGHYGMGGETLEHRVPTVYVSETLYEYFLAGFKDPHQREQMIDEYADYLYHKYMELYYTYVEEKQNAEAHKLVDHHDYRTEHQFIEESTFNRLANARFRLMQWIEDEQTDAFSFHFSENQISYLNKFGINIDAMLKRFEMKRKVTVHAPEVLTDLNFVTILVDGSPLKTRVLVDRELLELLLYHGIRSIEFHPEQDSDLFAIAAHLGALKASGRVLGEQEGFRRSGKNRVVRMQDRLVADKSGALSIKRLWKAKFNKEGYVEKDRKILKAIKEANDLVEKGQIGEAKEVLDQYQLALVKTVQAAGIKTDLIKQFYKTMSRVIFAINTRMNEIRELFNAGQMKEGAEALERIYPVYRNMILREVYDRFPDEYKLNRMVEDWKTHLNPVFLLRLELTSVLNGQSSKTLKQIIKVLGFFGVPVFLRSLDPTDEEAAKTLLRDFLETRYRFHLGMTEQLIDDVGYSPKTFYDIQRLVEIDVSTLDINPIAFIEEQISKSRYSRDILNRAAQDLRYATYGNLVAKFKRTGVDFDDFLRGKIIEAIALKGKHFDKPAAYLGMDEKTIRKKIRSLGIDVSKIEDEEHVHLEGALERLKVQRYYDLDRAAKSIGYPGARRLWQIYKSDASGQQMRAVMKTHLEDTMRRYGTNITPLTRILGVSGKILLEMISVLEIDTSAIDVYIADGLHDAFWRLKQEEAKKKGNLASIPITEVERFRIDRALKLMGWKGLRAFSVHMNFEDFKDVFREIFQEVSGLVKGQRMLGAKLLGLGYPAMIDYRERLGVPFDIIKTEAESDVDQLKQMDHFFTKALLRLPKEEAYRLDIAAHNLGFSRVNRDKSYQAFMKKYKHDPAVQAVLKVVVRQVMLDEGGRRDQVVKRLGVGDKNSLMTLLKITGLDSETLPYDEVARFKRFFRGVGYPNLPAMAKALNYGNVNVMMRENQNDQSFLAYIDGWIASALVQSDGSHAQAAHLLGMTHRKLIRNALGRIADRGETFESFSQKSSIAVGLTVSGLPDAIMKWTDEEGVLLSGEALARQRDMITEDLNTHRSHRDDQIAERAVTSVKRYMSKRVRALPAQLKAIIREADDDSVIKVMETLALNAYAWGEGVLSRDRYEQIQDEIRALTQSVDPQGEVPYHSLSFRKWLGLKRDFLQSKKVQKIGFAGYIEGFDRYFLGGASEENLYYDVELIQTLKKLDAQNFLSGKPTQLLAEYLFHEAMEHSGLGHQTIRLLQYYLFPENYPDGKPLLTVALRQYLHQSIQPYETMQTQVIDILRSYSGFLKQGFAPKDMPEEFIQEVQSLKVYRVRDVQKEINLTLYPYNYFRITNPGDTENPMLTFLWDPEKGLFFGIESDEGLWTVSRADDLIRVDEQAEEPVQLRAYRVREGESLSQVFSENRHTDILQEYSIILQDLNAL